MISARRPRPLTLREYLAIERMASSKSELVRGEMYALVGGTLAHSRVSANVISALHHRLKGKCTVYDSNLRVWLADAEIATYPDATVVCGDPVTYDDGPRDTVMNPIAVFEVLSPSTEAFDRGEKLLAYEACASMMHCVLINPDAAVVEVFTRQPNGTWLPAVAAGDESSLALTHLGIDLPLADIYAP